MVPCLFLLIATFLITTPTKTLAIKHNAAFAVFIPTSSSSFNSPSKTHRRGYPSVLLSPTTTNIVSLSATSNNNNEKDECKKYKSKLLQAISSENRTTILLAARDLENIKSQRPDPTKVGGEWSLVYSTQTDAIPGLDGGDVDTLFDKVNAVLYRFFFRFAPFLAGGQERDKNNSGSNGFGSSSSSSGSGLPGVTVANEQLVDITSMAVDNRVSLRLGSPKGLKADIRVIGDLSGDDPLDLGVTFTSFSVQIPPGPKIDIPLPRPVGRLRTTYCDDDMRLSRGGRGGIFVLKRMNRK